MVPTSPSDDCYELTDSGGGRVLEKLGTLVASRGCHAAWWRRKLPAAEWRKSVELKKELKEPMKLRIGTLRFLLSAQGGVRVLAPELQELWTQTGQMCAAFAEQQRRPARVLNLFGGSAGGFTLAAAQAGAAVAHVDASADAIKHAREHAAINTLANRDIRWVVDDPVKFAQRERTQAGRYDLIIVDPHTPKDAKRGFEPERDLGALIATVSGLLSDKPVGVILCCRQGAVSATTLQHLMRQEFSIFGGSVGGGEILLKGAEGVPAVPSGVYATWRKTA